MSQNTVHTPDEVGSVATADCAKDLAREHSDTGGEDKNLAGSLGDDIEQFASTHSVYHEVALGS